MMTAPQLNGFITHYGNVPFDRPKHLIPEFLETVDKCSWARTPDRQMTIAGAVSALIQLYPVDQPGWQSKYPEVFKLVMATVRAHTAIPDHPGWVGLHLARWFILRDSGEVDQILKLAGRGGETGEAANKALEVTSSLFPSFKRDVASLRRAERPMVTLQ